MLFLEEFGKTPDQLFKTFDPNPVAAASLAQVFKATTFDDRQVAVKVNLTCKAEGDWGGGGGGGGGGKAS